MSKDELYPASNGAPDYTKFGPEVIGQFWWSQVPEATELIELWMTHLEELDRTTNGLITEDEYNAKFDEITDRANVIFDKVDPEKRRFGGRGTYVVLAEMAAHKIRMQAGSAVPEDIHE